MRAWSSVDRDGLTFISLPEWLQDGVDIAFSGRRGGISAGVYDSLNLGLHVGDQPEAVLENRRRFLALFEAGLDEAVCCQQVHGSLVCQVERADRGRGARSLDDALLNCDAMITNIPKVYLLSLYADCVPVYFYDPVKRVVGIAHCGWKGTLDRIAQKTLQAMQASYQTAAEQVQIFIGPGIGSCCFIIQSGLREKVCAEFNSLHDIITNGREGVITWDLQETNRQLLVESGVKASRISVCRLCTACHTETFYSHRKEMGQTGRMGALLALKY